jgi:hypothetical protein
MQMLKAQFVEVRAGRVEMVIFYAALAVALCLVGFACSCLLRRSAGWQQNLSCIMLVALLVSGGAIVSTPNGPLHDRIGATWFVCVPFVCTVSFLLSLFGRKSATMPQPRLQASD